MREETVRLGLRVKERVCARVWVKLRVRECVCVRVTVTVSKWQCVCVSVRECVRDRQRKTSGQKEERPGRQHTLA